MFVVGLRSVSKKGPAYEWLNQERKKRGPAPEFEWQLNPIQAWDALFFIREISPARRQDAPK